MTIDRDKLTRGLQNRINESRNRGGIAVPVALSTPSEALMALKEQEPVEPERECSGGGTTWWNVCGACRTAINPNDKYCHECGRTVKWRC